MRGIEGERVIIKISWINMKNNMVGLKKKVYWGDGIEGIYVGGKGK